MNLNREIKLRYLVRDFATGIRYYFEFFIEKRSNEYLISKMYFRTNVKNNIKSQLDYDFDKNHFSLMTMNKYLEKWGFDFVANLDDTVDIKTMILEDSAFYLDVNEDVDGQVFESKIKKSNNQFRLDYDERIIDYVFNNSKEKAKDLDWIVENQHGDLDDLLNTYCKVIEIFK